MGSNPTEPAISQTHSDFNTQTIVLIQQHKLWLESEGYASKTVRSSISNLKSLAKHSDITDPESVKRAIAKRDISEGTKEKLTITYDRFCKHNSIQWSKPKYRRVKKIPYVPSEKDIDQLIGGMSPRLGTIILFLKETGCRLGEMWSVKWRARRTAKDENVVRAIIEEIWENPERGEEILAEISNKNKDVYDFERMLEA